MASQLQVLLTASTAGFEAAMNSAGKSTQILEQELDKATKKVEQSGTVFEGAAQKVDRAGRQARIGLSSMSQAAQLVGVDISGVIAPAAQAADAIGDLTGAVGDFGVAGGVIGLSLAAMGLLIAKIQEINRAQVEGVKSSDDYLRSFRDIAAVTPAAAAAVERLAQAQNNLAQSNQRIMGAGSANIYIHQVAAETYEKERQALESAYGAATQASNALEKLRETSYNASTGLGSLSASAVVAAANLRALTTDTAAYYDNLLKVQGATNTQFYNLGVQSQELAKNNDAVTASNNYWGAYNDMIGRKYPIAVATAKASTQDWLTTVKQSITDAQNAAKAAQELFKSLVEGAMSPTSVTDQDKKDTAAGKYADKWDEFRRRLDAVATGTDPNKFGKAFSEAFKGLGLSAEEASKKFKDFSLFADPKNLKLIDMGAVIADVKEQIQGMIGKANVMKEAMGKVWDSLSPQERGALGAQGIKSASDALAAIGDPTGASSAQKHIADITKQIKDIPNHTVMLDVDKVKEWGKHLKDILDTIPQTRTIYIDVVAGTPPTGGTPPPTGSSGGGVRSGDQSDVREMAHTIINNNSLSIPSTFPGVTSALDADALVKFVARKLGEQMRLSQALGR